MSYKTYSRRGTTSERVTYGSKSWPTWTTDRQSSSDTLVPLQEALLGSGISLMSLVLRNQAISSAFCRQPQVYIPRSSKRQGYTNCPRRRPDLALQQSLLDAREQALIALMGIATSLNTQHGGKFVTFTPDPQMKMEFERMKTKTIQRLRLDTIDCTDAANTQISLYVDAIQAYANDNPHSTGTTQFSFTAELRECYYNQAVPRVLRSTGFFAYGLYWHKSHNRQLPYFDSLLQCCRL